MREQRKIEGSLIDLSPSKWDLMKAGRELDELVAAKVFDKTLLTYEVMRNEALKVWEEQPSCYHFLMGFTAYKEDDGIIVAYNSVREFSKNYGGFCVLDRMEALGYTWTLTNLRQARSCKFVKIDMETVLITGAKISEVICIAALQTLEYNSEAP